jgi:hypothetical protein
VQSLLSDFLHDRSYTLELFLRLMKDAIEEQERMMDMDDIRCTTRKKLSRRDRGEEKKGSADVLFNGKENGDGVADEVIRLIESMCDFDVFAQMMNHVKDGGSIS